MFSGKLLVNSYLLFLFVGQAIGKFSTGRVPRSVHCWQAIGRLHTTRKMVLTPWFIAVNTIAYWGLIALPQKTFLKRFYKPKKPFEKSLRAPMEDQGTKDGTVTGSKADQKKIQPRDLFWRPKFAAILASSNRPLSVFCQPARSTVFSAKPTRSCEPEHWPNLARTTISSGKFGADLCKSEHLAKNPFSHRRARFSWQNRRGPARTLAFRPETHRGPRLLSAKQADLAPGFWEA